MRPWKKKMMVVVAARPVYPARSTAEVLVAVVGGVEAAAAVVVELPGIPGLMPVREAPLRVGPARQ